MLILFHHKASLLHGKIFLSLVTVFYFACFSVISQESNSVDGINVIVQKRENSKNAYIFITGGYQSPAFFRVPMTPERFPELKKKGDMEVQVPGWFTGVGIIRKTKSRFEVGLLADYYRNSVPVALSGQRSGSDWVFEQSNNESYYTRVFEKDLLRIGEVISFRGTVRYKIPANNFRFWGGITGGAFSSAISFSGENVVNSAATYRETTLGLTWQTGIDFLIKDSFENDLLGITLFCDLAGPKVEEKVISLFYPSWIYHNTAGNHAVHPVRIGIAVGVHLN